MQRGSGHPKNLCKALIATVHYLLGFYLIFLFSIFTLPYIEWPYSAGDHLVRNTFQFTNGICANLNDSRHCLLRQ